MTTKRPQLEAEYENSIRDGEALLGVRNQTGKAAIQRAVNNTKIRLARVRAGLEPGRMVFRNGSWDYEFGSPCPAP